MAAALTACPTGGLVPVSADLAAAVGSKRADDSNDDGHRDLAIGMPGKPVPHSSPAAPPTA
ncbi:hypothetical protein [Streptomyces sp. NRRL S-1896]|uniref:hypothetical protein n=1 Tax=Streptomyces sp. NRRL S-1896 TaxID=1463893 RepID=UPI001F3B923E|nr:hypothetical protein [Streptomyces sp. NRRL S-1896]